jgi:hypothetical protein
VTGIRSDEQKIARGGLCLLGMVFLMAQAAESPTSPDMVFVYIWRL